MKRGQKCPLFYFEKLKKELHLHVPKFKRLYHLSKASYTILNEGLQTDRITTYASIDDNSMTVHHEALQNSRHLGMHLLLFKLMLPKILSLTTLKFLLKMLYLVNCNS